MASAWIPRVNTARRIAGRLMRAYRGGLFELSHLERQDCIDTITTRFLSHTLRRRMGGLWAAMGPTILESGWADARPQPELDEPLDALVQRE